MRRPLVLTIVLLTGIGAIAPAAAAAGRVVAATGQWAAIDRGDQCDATSRSLRVVREGVQARAGFAFDPTGPRSGQFYTQLRRPVREGSTVILKVDGRPFLLAARQGWAWSRDSAQDRAIMAAVRSARWLRIEARDGGGRRFTEHYSAEGAPTAIDAAAAHCASLALAKSRQRN